MIEQSVSLASNGVVKVPGYEQLVRFGYTKNRGVYRLAVTATGEWEGLTIRAFWHVPGGDDPASTLVVDGCADVPASVTAQPGNGCVTFEGSDGTKTVTSADLHYRVSANSGTEDGTEPEPGTPAWQQLVDAVHTDATTAEQAKTDAQTAAHQAGASAQKAGQALSDTITAKEDALKAIGDKQTTATQAVDAARDKALKQVEDSTEAAQTAASEAATSAGNADQSAKQAAGSLQELKDGIASGDFKGEKGDKGDTGPIGPGGPQGETGPQGPTGATGATGPQGKTGPRGEQGPQGEKGDIGPQGPKGDVGPAGADGKGAPQIDDTTVTDSAPWSSKHIVDMLCPPLEETGNPVQCYPVANYPLGVVASWEPTQEGSGEPSPENIRPIKGRDSVTVTRCGKNLFNPAWMPEKTLNSGLTWTIAPDGTVTATGTADGTSYYNSDYFSLPAGTYTISAMPHFRISIINRDADKATTIAAQIIGQPYTFTVESDIQKANLFFAAAGTLDNASAKPQIEKGTTATTYTPYIGQTSTLTLPRTIYGGEVDAVTGDGQETWKLVTLDGTETWTPETTNISGKSGFCLRVKDIQTPTTPDQKGQIVCNKYVTRSANDTYTAKTGISIEADNHKYFRIYDEVYADKDVADWKAYLAAQYAAGTPVQVAYKLATPTPFTATGAQPIPALSGINTVLTDADSVAVTGRADPIKRITDLEDAVASMT
nr:MAG TPA: collagen triple helix repeat protein [Bacteriophage sp.]